MLMNGWLLTITHNIWRKTATDWHNLTRKTHTLVLFFQAHDLEEKAMEASEHKLSIDRARCRKVRRLLLNAFIAWIYDGILLVIPEITARASETR